MQLFNTYREGAGGPAGPVHYWHMTTGHHMDAMFTHLKSSRKMQAPHEIKLMGAPVGYNIQIQVACWVDPEMVQIGPRNDSGWSRLEFFWPWEYGYPLITGAYHVIRSVGPVPNKLMVHDLDTGRLRLSNIRDVISDGGHILGYRTVDEIEALRAQYATALIAPDNMLIL